jgi:hypothetical protein
MKKCILEFSPPNLAGHRAPSIWQHQDPNVARPVLLDVRPTLERWQQAGAPALLSKLNVAILP